MGAETAKNGEVNYQVKLQSMDRILHEISRMDNAESEDDLARSSNRSCRPSGNIQGQTGSIFSTGQMTCMTA